VARVGRYGARVSLLPVHVRSLSTIRSPGMARAGKPGSIEPVPE
jgi:hypothetical protein